MISIATRFYGQQPYNHIDSPLPLCSPVVRQLSPSISPNRHLHEPTSIYPIASQFRLSRATSKIPQRPYTLYFLQTSRVLEPYKTRHLDGQSMHNHIISPTFSCFLD
jgi:hypothetical protein